MINSFYKYILVLIGLSLVFLFQSIAQCDVTISGNTIHTLTYGQTGCLTRSFFGTIIVGAGANLVMCGSYDMSVP